MDGTERGRREFAVLLGAFRRTPVLVPVDGEDGVVFPPVRGTVRERWE